MRVLPVGEHGLLSRRVPAVQTVGSVLPGTQHACIGLFHCRVLTVVGQVLPGKVHVQYLTVHKVCLVMYLPH